MTILSALVRRYDRLLSVGRIAPEGYEPANISFSIMLNDDGSIDGVDDERRMVGTDLKPISRLVPSPRSRTGNVCAYSLCDNAEYIFGQGAEADQKVAERHAAFVKHHHELLDGVDDPAARALLAFLDSRTPDRFSTLEHADEMAGKKPVNPNARKSRKPKLDNNKPIKPFIAFRHVDDIGGYIHDRPAIQRRLAEIAAGSEFGKPGMCLVSGGTAPIATLHPPIGGVEGAKTSGARLVSFNCPSFESYGKSQGANAPVSVYAAAAYTKALNALLASSATTERGRPIYRNRIVIGDATTVFWAEHGDAESFARAALGGDDAVALDDMPAVDDVTETDKIKDALSRLADGIPMRDAAPDIDPETRVYVLGMTGAAARISVAFWRDTSLGEFASAIQQHYADLHLHPAPKKPPGVWHLLIETAVERKPDTIKPGLGADLLRAILTGAPYPPALLAQTVLRIDADRDVNPTRAAIIKACLIRRNRKEYIPVSLDLSVADPPYRLGCAFAVLERLQKAALGSVGTNIRDRFIVKASNTPAAVMPVLLDGATAHLKTVRTRPGCAGLAEWFDQRIAAAMDGGGSMPTILAPIERGRFYLGYYEQKIALGRQAPKEIETVEAAADTEASTGK